MNSPHKGPVTRNMFSFDDVIMDMKNQYKALNLLKVPRVNYKVSTVGNLEKICRFITTSHCLVLFETIYGRKPQVMNILRMRVINHHYRFIEGIIYFYVFDDLLEALYVLWYKTWRVRRAAKCLCAHNNVVLRLFRKARNAGGDRYPHTTPMSA